MLVLTRKQFQSIVLSNGTTFKVLDIARGSVRVGVESPSGVLVLRGECVEHDDRVRRETK